MLRIRWLIAVAALSFSPVIAMGADTSARLPVLTNDDAWKRLPGAPSTPQQLPMWARMYAGPMPLATSAMLELDAMHRTGDRLAPRARALIRWSAADANACEYSKAVAVRDFPELPKLLANPDRLEIGERAAMLFARKMMLRAYAVTDEEFKAVHDAFGEEPTVAIVSMLAFASFHDRLILAMNAPLEPDGPPPPLMVKFERPKPKPHPMGADMIGKTGRVANASKGLANDDEWLRMTFRDLRNNLDQQRERSGRIRVPSKAEVTKRLGEGHPALWQNDILWSRVCNGFQPELTAAWFECVTQFRQESKLDRVFEQCIFWVVTRSLQCFY